MGLGKGKKGVWDSGRRKGRFAKGREGKRRSELRIKLVKTGSEIERERENLGRGRREGVCDVISIFLSSTLS